MGTLKERPTEGDQSDVVSVKQEAHKQVARQSRSSSLVLPQAAAQSLGNQHEEQGGERAALRDPPLNLDLVAKHRSAAVGKQVSHKADVDLRDVEPPKAA